MGCSRVLSYNQRAKKRSAREGLVGAAKSLSIKQAARLYGVSIDTLRYYEEIGLVVPERDPNNGYRRYSERDFERLNITFSLLEMDFSLAKIKELLDDHCLSKSLELISFELGDLECKIDVLEKKRKKVESCLLGLANAMHDAPLERVFVREYPQRPCLTISPMPANADDIPRIVAEKARELQIPIDAFHSVPCFRMDVSTVNDRGHFEAKSVMLFNAAPSLNSTTFFPAGKYASVTFSGPVQATPSVYRKMLDYVGEHGLSPVGDLLEFWHIHEYISQDSSEYIHTIEQRVV